MDIVNFCDQTNAAFLPKILMAVTSLNKIKIKDCYVSRDTLNTILQHNKQSLSYLKFTSCLLCSVNDFKLVVTQFTKPIELCLVLNTNRFIVGNVDDLLDFCNSCGIKVAVF